MILISREIYEQREKEFLASYAVKSADSIGREYDEPEDEYRTCFQRDRDRVIHSKAFRRLKGKTQVFVAHYGDHYRSRLTHTMEVAQISRDLARMLGLNEDLAETIALAHDLGHTPFGHAGQETMDEIMKTYGGCFEHNEQSKRVVESLEEKSNDYSGLNLTFEVRDGLIKHRTSYDHPSPTDTNMPSFEAQIVNIADEIAYLCHDTDDGLRAGILSEAGLSDLKIWSEAKKGVPEGFADHLFISAIVHNLMSRMIKDLGENSFKAVKSSRVTTPEEVCNMKKPIAFFSDEIQIECDELKDFLYKNFYTSSGVMGYNRKGQEIIRYLFRKYMDYPDKLPEKSRKRHGDEELYVFVKDHIAGMTDEYALKACHL